MRLTDHQRNVIREAAREIFGESSIVKLFGSRIDDSLRGGDIDLLIECPSPIGQSGLKSATLAARIQRRLGDQKVDVMCIEPDTALSLAHKSAIANGVEI